MVIMVIVIKDVTKKHLAILTIITKKEEISMTNFTDLQTKRRSIYALGKDVELSNQELIDTIQGAVLNTPTAFNSQTSRVVILLDEESDDFWNEIAYSELEKVTPADAFEGTKERLKGNNSLL